MIDIKTYQVASIEEESLNELTELLIAVVNDGASVGFLAPLDPVKALNYWLSVPDSSVILLLARMNGRIVGTAQLHLCMKENANHRAETAKLMVHPAFRRNGVAKTLMKALEELAESKGRELLVLDTREGDPSNILYQSMGYVIAGIIPYYARSSSGGYDATVFYYKFLAN